MEKTYEKFTYYFKSNDSNAIKVEYTFGYKLVNGKLKIDLHHSSLPYSSDSWDYVKNTGNSSWFIYLIYG